MENKDKLSLLISFLALLVAGLSLWISYKAFSIEDLMLQVSDYREIYTANIRESYEDEYPALVEKLYKAMLINNGGNTINIVYGDINQRLDGPPPILPFGTTYFLGSEAILDENKKTINFPLTIKAGEIKVLFLVGSIRLNTEIYDKLKDKYPVNSTGVYEEIREYIQKQGIDLYGNPLHITKDRSGNNRYQWKSKNPAMQYYEFYLKSSRGNTVSAIFSEFKPNP